jgi:ABC-type Fe3+/spermidine/putrescine transport system ATPase subunit
LAVRPDLLLLDEPLSALDQESRERLQVDLKQVHRELGVTTLHVTHDFEEAMSLGQRIAVLDGGRVRQVGSPEDIFFRPVSVLVARYTMSRNIFNGKVVYRQNGRVIFETGSGWRLEASSGAREDNYACIRPEYIGISPLSPPEATNTFRGHVVDIAKRGVYNVIRVAVGASQVTSYALLKESRDLKAGQNVWISFEPEVVYLLKDAPVP